MVIQRFIYLLGVELVGLSSSSPFKGNFIGVFGVDSVCKKATKACAKDMSKPVASWISVDEVRL